MQKISITFLPLLAALFTASSLFAYEFSEALSINGVLSGAIQCQDLSESKKGVRLD
jgi:hypothetical protein